MASRKPRGRRFSARPTSPFSPEGGLNLDPGDDLTQGATTGRIARGGAEDSIARGLKQRASDSSSFCEPQQHWRALDMLVDERCVSRPGLAPVVAGPVVLTKPAQPVILLAVVPGLEPFATLGELPIEQLRYGGINVESLYATQQLSRRHACITVLPSPEVQFAINVLDGRHQRARVLQHPVLLPPKRPGRAPSLHAVVQLYEAQDLAAGELGQDLRQLDASALGDEPSGLVERIGRVLLRGGVDQDRAAVGRGPAPILDVLAGEDDRPGPSWVDRQNAILDAGLEPELPR